MPCLPGGSVYFAGKVVKNVLIHFVNNTYVFLPADAGYLGWELNRQDVGPGRSPWQDPHTARGALVSIILDSLARMGCFVQAAMQRLCAKNFFQTTYSEDSAGSAVLS